MVLHINYVEELQLNCTFCLLIVVKNQLVTFVKSFTPSLISCHFILVGLIQNQPPYFSNYFIPLLQQKIEEYQIKNHGADSKIVNIPYLL